MPLKASAPGSLMLLGEYAVLDGKPALVAAIDKRITVTLIPRDDEEIIIHSALHGDYQTGIPQLEIVKPYQFVLGALKQYQAKLKRGCDIQIVSDFSDKVGLGSSAAVTVAVLAAVSTWLNIRILPMDLVRQGRQIVRQVQGVGSGADIAASVYGGIIAYQAQPLAVEKFSMICPLTVLYAGFKTPTVEAIKHVQNYFSSYPNLFRHLSHTIGQCAVEGKELVRKGAWEALGHIMNVQQGMMESLGVSMPLLHDMVAELRQQPNIVGAKISGAGLGDCVIGLGAPPASVQFASLPTGVQHLPVAMASQGVHCEQT